MKIEVIKYNGDEYEIDCLWFEFRTNHCANWIKVKYQDGRIEYIHDVCVIKGVEVKKCLKRLGFTRRY